VAYAKVSGIYRIECSGNGKHYIGSAVSLKQRMACHRSMLRNGTHTNKHLQRAWNKYGEDSFSMATIEECGLDILIEREQHWIDATQAANPQVGMNNSPTASTTIGFRHSDDTRVLLSEIGKRRDHAHLRILAAQMKGKPSASRGTTGTHWTEERKKEASRQRKGSTPWNVGVPMPDEVKARVSASVTANRRVIPEATRAKIIALREGGMTYPRISKETGVSIAQSHRIATGYIHAMRTVEKVNGIKAGH